MLIAKRDLSGLYVFLLGLGIFCIASNQSEVIGFESRFYLFAIEMWRHGPSWFATTYHEPYPDYPGTSTFIIYLCSKMFGELTRFSAILPTAVISALTLMVTYFIGAFYDKRLGLSAVCFLLLTYYFVAEARTISLDQYTTFITALCFYLVMCKRYFWIYPLLIFSFAIRGPIGLVIPAGVVCISLLIDKNYKQLLVTGIYSGLLLVGASLLLLGLAYIEGGRSFVQDVIDLQVVGRFQEAVNLPWYFYFVEGLIPYTLIYPLAIMMVLGFGFAKPNNKKFILKLMGWALIILVGLSIPTNKKIRYLLPFTPALALICAYFYTRRDKNLYYQIIRNMIYVLCFLLPAMCLVGLVVAKQFHPAFMSNFFMWISLFALLQSIILLIHFKNPNKEILVLMLASGCFVMSYVGIVEPIHFSLNQTKKFVLKIENNRHQTNSKLAFYRENSDGVVIKYLVNMPNDERPMFVNNPHHLLLEKSKIYYATSNDNFAAIPLPIRDKFSVIFEGKIGHIPFVVFHSTA